MSSILLAVATLLGGGLAHADEAGDAWLARIDAAAHVEQAHLVLDVEVTDKRGQTAPRTLAVWQQGDDARLVRLLAPTRLQGTSLLVDGDDTVHLFLPAYPPARRVVGSKRQDSFMGTDFAVEDLARLTYSGRYDCTVVAEAEGPDGLTELALVPHERSKVAQLALWVDGKSVVRKVEHRDAEDKVMRRLTMDDVRAVDGVHLAHKLQVEDLARGRKTVAILREADLASPLSAELFTVTNLERP